MKTETEFAGFAARLDHLVVGATTLDQGIKYIERLLGESMVAGGQHVKMGTHNCLLGLGPDLYLEVIAVDQSLPAPDNPRWFDLDDPHIRRRLGLGPGLLHWVAGVSSMEGMTSEVAAIFGPVTRMSRGELHWQITIPEDGSRPGGGCLPSLICWPNGMSPARKLPDSGWRLQRLVVEHPETVRYDVWLAGIEPQAEIRYQPGTTLKLQAVLGKNGREAVLS